MLAAQQAPRPGAKFALRLADVILPTNINHPPHKAVADMILNKSPDFRDRFLTQIADHSLGLTTSKDRNEQAEGIRRLKTITSRHMAVDLSGAAQAKPEKLVTTLVNTLSKPGTANDLRDNIQKILLSPSLRQQTGAMLSSVANEAFVAAVADYAQNPQGARGGEAQAWELMQLCFGPLSDGLVDLYFETLQQPKGEA